MISCGEVLKELANYIEEEVTAELRAQIQEHLKMCRNCTVLVNTTRRTITVVADNFISDLPAGLSKRVIERLGLR
jgi:predicted anti-sigma-YlaC factor YlaD